MPATPPPTTRSPSAWRKKARFMVLVPCCQAEVAACLRADQGAGAVAHAAGRALAPSAAHARDRQPAHQRAALPVPGSARLPGTVTELVGWEHSMKNELIIGRATPASAKPARPTRLRELLAQFGLDVAAGDALSPALIDALNPRHGPPAPPHAGRPAAPRDPARQQPPADLRRPRRPRAAAGAAGRERRALRHRAARLRADGQPLPSARHAVDGRRAARS